MEKKVELFSFAIFCLVATTQTRVTREQDTIGMVLVAPRPPVSTRPVHLCVSILGLDFGFSLEELDAQTGGNVEGDMAVHEPCTRVVRLESKDQVTSSGKIGCVPTDGVVRLQGRNISVPDSVFDLCEDVEVVAVEVDGVGKRWVGAVLLDDPVLPLEHLLITSKQY